MHLAASILPNTMMSKVASVVLFGDPKNGTGVSGVEDAKVLIVCYAGDDICKGGDVVGSAHLDYSAGWWPLGPLFRGCGRGGSG